MTYENVFSMLGAIAVFLFGMTTMTDGLEKLAGGKLSHVLEKLTDNIFKGILVGALVTALIHSSATTTVMCVGFVNAGIMNLYQAVGIIMGANIGTTVTAQILRLTSISGEGNLVLTLLQPSVLGPLTAVIGIIFYMFLKGAVRKNIGQVLLGTGLLFIGMNTMTVSVSPLQNEPWLKDLFTAFSNPILGMLVGALITALLQSSTAFTGILQALSTTGAVRFNTAIPLILGQNVGTTLTALISSAGASKNAKRVALIHLFFNLIGSLFFLVVLYAGNAIFSFPFWEDTMDMGSVANFHLLFNLTCTALLLPANKLLVRAAEKLIPGETQLQDSSMLDDRFLATPAIALERAHEALLQMGAYAWENYRLSVGLLTDFDQGIFDMINETESSLDQMQDNLNNYLIRLTKRDLAPTESGRVTELIRALSDFERIGDYSVNLAESAQLLHDQDLTFSPIALQELAALTDAVGEVLDRTMRCVEERSFDRALTVEPLEEVVDLLCEDLRFRHVERFKSGECPVEAGTQFLELLFNLERISDHCSNVAICILRETSPLNSLVRSNSHNYTHQLHERQDPEFQRMFAEGKAKYYDTLPAPNSAWQA